MCCYLKHIINLINRLQKTGLKKHGQDKEKQLYFNNFKTAVKLIWNEPEGTHLPSVRTILIAAKSEISNTAIKLNWNAALETGGVLVSDEVKITAEVQFAKEVA